MNLTTIRKAAIVATLGFASVSGAALAQNATDTGYSDTNTTTYTTVEKDDNDFPWGLLGLLGLAGLLGRKRKEADIHVDARRDTRP